MHIFNYHGKKTSKTWKKVLSVKLREEINVDGQSLQRRKMQASIATIVSQALQHCFCNTKY